MKAPSGSIHVEFSTEYRGRDITISATVDGFTIGNDGIGAYEYWGAKGFDAGRDYLEEFNFEKLAVFSERRKEYVKPSPRLHEKLKEYLYEDEKFVTKIEEELYERDEYMADYYEELRRERGE